MPTLARRYLALSHRVVEALIDPRRQRFAVTVLLVGFVVLWTAYGTLGHAFRDVHSDIGEALGWWRYDAQRYHPPVGTWVVGGWFSVLPRFDVLVYLLAAAVVGATLLIAWVLFGDWLDPDKRVVALAMLSFLPFFSFLGSKPNANLIQMPLWAAASLFFLRSFVQRGAVPAALTSVSVVGALLTKFWSVYLAAGMALAAVVDRRRLRYFGSPAPWIAAGLAGALLLPFALSLASTPDTLGRVSGLMTEQTHGAALLRSVQYLVGAALYATPALLVLTMLRPSSRALADIAVPSSQDGRLIALLFWIPLALPALANALFPHRLTALWTFPNWTLLPVLLLGSPLVVVTRRMTACVMAVAMALPVLAVLIAPAIAAVIFLQRPRHIELHYRAVAGAVDAAWRKVTTCPLRFVGGEPDLARGATFYLEAAAPNFSPHMQLREGKTVTIPAEGMALACRARELLCMAELDAIERQFGGDRSEIAPARQHLGIASDTERFVLLMLPPKC